MAGTILTVCIHYPLTITLKVDTMIYFIDLEAEKLGNLSNPGTVIDAR